MDEGSIVARSIIQIAGAPKEYIESTLQSFISRREQEGLKVRSKDFAEARQEGSLFVAFVEIVAEFGNVHALLAFCFDAMPSSVEILEPDIVSFKSFDFSNSLNDLQARLHENEMVVKRLKGANELLDKNGLELLRNFISFMVRGKRMTVDEVSGVVGVRSEDLKPFLDKMVEENRLSVSDGNYFIE